MNDNPASCSNKTNASVHIEVDAQIIFRRRGFQARILRLSEEGMHLHIEALTVPRGMLIEIAFSMANHQWHVSGVVTHCDMHGLSIMFRVPQPELLKVAREQLDKELENPRLQIQPAANRYLGSTLILRKHDSDDFHPEI